ncbi:MAG: ATP-binding cassette domain-containing protein [Bacteroidales bacterium]|nr:ATP-binding cassette domain-containing protein [Bacteroidales bacterium]
MNKHQYLQSFEILIALINAYQGQLKKHLSFLERTANNLDSVFQCDDFNTVLIQFKSLERNEDQKDILFVDYHDLPVRYSNIHILSFDERIILYSCVLNWVKNEKDRIFDAELLQKVFLIETDLQQALDSYFSIETEERSFGKNELFLLKPEEKSEESLEGQWIRSNEPNELKSNRSFFIEGIDQVLKILYVEQIKTFMLTCNDCNSIVKKNELNNLYGWEYLEPGEKIVLRNKFEISYHDLKNIFLSEKYSQKLQMEIRNLAYSYSNGKGIKQFSLTIEPGTLIGILGKEGSGKSTLLKLLAGEIPCGKDQIIINGYDLSKDLYQMKGIIGFVPEEDLLYNELTVYENLYLTAKLYLGKTSPKDIHRKVENLLTDLELQELKNSVVGSMQDKHLQPGQRRLLNIALELLRDPQILIVDNAITPLSLADSSKIIEVLANYSFHGKIVITSITQTNKKFFSEFDKIFVLDEGGFPVYFGRTTDTIGYFAELFHLKHNKNEYFTPEAILQFIHQKKYRDEGDQYRYKTPVELYKEFLNSNVFPETREEVSRKILPEKILYLPTLERQYLTFFIRNFKTKISRSRELVYAVLVTPFLALIISLFLHKSNGPGYSFSLNPHIPAYIFLSTIIAVFLGLIQSANEIFKERTINKKQEYLNLSMFSYINSKITYLLVIALIQSLLFVGIGNMVLSVKGTFWVDWLIFFSCQSFGILLGLIFSNTRKSLESIYVKSIPIALIIQILLGGGFFSLDAISLKYKRYTPFIADLAVSRWAYEASMVYHFKQNKYERKFYDLDRDISSGKMNYVHLMPIVKSQIQYCEKEYQSHQDSVKSKLQSIKNILVFLANNYEVFPYENIHGLNLSDFNSMLAKDLLEYVEYLELHFYSMHANSKDLKEEYEKQISDSLGPEFLRNLRSAYYNYAIADKVTNDSIQDPIRFYNNTPVQIKHAVFKYPDSDIGRGQMFIPEKQISGQRIDTLEFNVSVIWMINLMLYVMLVTNLLSRLGIRNRSG